MDFWIKRVSNFANDRQKVNSPRIVNRDRDIPELRSRNPYLLCKSQRNLYLYGFRNLYGFWKSVWIIYRLEEF